MWLFAIRMIVLYSYNFLFKKMMKSMQVKVFDGNDRGKRKHEEKWKALKLKSHSKLETHTVMRNVVFRKFNKPYIIKCDCEKCITNALPSWDEIFIKYYSWTFKQTTLIHCVDGWMLPNQKRKKCLPFIWVLQLVYLIVIVPPTTRSLFNSVNFATIEHYC